MDTYTNDGEPSMTTDKKPDNYSHLPAHPVGATHPNHPDTYRAPAYSYQKLQRMDKVRPVNVCDDCPVGTANCDYSCGSDYVWVGPVTWIRIRMMENQA